MTSKDTKSIIFALSCCAKDDDKVANPSALRLKKEGINTLCTTLVIALIYISVHAPFGDGSFISYMIVLFLSFISMSFVRSLQKKKAIKTLQYTYVYQKRINITRPFKTIPKRDKKCADGPYQQKLSIFLF